MEHNPACKCVGCEINRKRSIAMDLAIGYRPEQHAFDEQRADVIGQNGNDGGHYDLVDTGVEAEPLSALEVQVGGDHYKKLAIQPMTYSMANGLDACQHTIIKYVTRFRDKGGIDDLEKAKHTIDMLIEFEIEKGAKQ